MAELSETPRGERVRIAFFGLRNAGKSTLVNAFTGQEIAIVSDVAGTTTDPVSKAMEIAPLGPCLVTDTAGLDDDAGELGAARVARTLAVLEATDVAVWVSDGAAPTAEAERLRAAFLDECRRRRVAVLDYRRGDSVEGLRAKVAALRIGDDAPGILEGLVTAGDRVVFVCPIDAAAPKGRLILPQVEAIRECLDRHATCAVCQPQELTPALAEGALVVTDSQAFRVVAARLAPVRGRVRLTSFSILFARRKGDFAAFAAGLDAVARLKDGDTVLVAEGCTHRRQCGDIGTEKIPKALRKISGRDLRFVFASGPAPSNIQTFKHSNVSLVVHCGGCMLTRREVLARIERCRAAGVPVVNYGMVLAAAGGLRLLPGTCLAEI